jgi:hypothetical protein
MHLTYRDFASDIAAASPVDSGGAGAPAKEIEITPEMIEAGKCALFESWDDYPDTPGVCYVQNKIVRNIFTKMLTKAVWFKKLDQFN